MREKLKEKEARKVRGLMVVGFEQGKRAKAMAKWWLNILEKVAGKWWRKG